MDLAISFLVSVAAGIVAHYVCKWLDRDGTGDQPEDQARLDK